MSEQELERLKYPIGRVSFDPNVTEEARASRIEGAAAIPAGLRAAVAGLNDEQLDTLYRPGGWTVRQVAHHTADASMTMYTRFKLALTEEKPLVKTFEENEWVKLVDSAKLPVEPALLMLDGLHARIDAVLRSLPASAFSTTFLHPANGEMTLDQLLSYFAWHGKHHTAQITALRERSGW
ncbi:YfiT family bacillithiol transferase [Cohnella sp. GCM10027633]|uniref:YfiT family bacillithiol transferase n=1 Tax=unclassified Cohnella TaxID=2636738 RepID=UPI00362B6DF5